MGALSPPGSPLAPVKLRLTDNAPSETDTDATATANANANSAASEPEIIGQSGLQRVSSDDFGPGQPALNSLFGAKKEDDADGAGSPVFPRTQSEEPPNLSQTQPISMPTDAPEDYTILPGGIMHAEPEPEKKSEPVAVAEEEDDDDFDFFAMISGHKEEAEQADSGWTIEEVPEMKALNETKLTG